MPSRPIRSRRYLNAAARVETALPRAALLALCLDVERGLGRVRPPGQTPPRAPSTSICCSTTTRHRRSPDLVVPHPRLLERAFVRIPLADVALPGLVHPMTGERARSRRTPPRPSGCC